MNDILNDFFSDEELSKPVVKPIPKPKPVEIEKIVPEIILKPITTPTLIPKKIATPQDSNESASVGKAFESIFGNGKINYPGKRPDFLYVPAIGEQIITNILSTKDTMGGKHLTWWEDDKSIFQHPAVLVSAFYGLMREDEVQDENTPLYRDKLNISKNTLFIGDSGGFQKATLQSNPAHREVLAKLTPERVTAWQEENCDIGLILDKPPYWKPKGATKVNWTTSDPRKFQEALDFTCNSAEIAVNQYNPKKMKLFGVLQGRNYNDLVRWHDEISKYEFDGWALAPKPTTDVMAVAMYAAFAIEMGFKVPIHFLAISGLNTIALIIYLLRKDEHGEQYFPYGITSDSSSYNTGSIYRRYMVPNDYNLYLILGRTTPQFNAAGVQTKEANPNSSTINILPCSCPICSHTTPDNMRTSNNLAGISLSLHNLGQYNNFINVLVSLIDDVPAYKEFIRRTAVRSLNSTSHQPVEDLHLSLKAMSLMDEIVKHKGEKKMLWPNILAGSRSALEYF